MSSGVYIRTEENKRSISKAVIKRFKDPKERKKISEAQKGKKRKPHTEETKRKIGMANKGKSHIPGNRLFIINYEKLKELYIDKEWLQKRCAKYFQCSDGTIKGHLLRKNINVRNCSEARKLAKLSGENSPLYGIHRSEETKEKVRKARMEQVIPKRDTKIERKIQDSLKRVKIIYEVYKNIFGQPDIFIAPNICIFCDGDYWHNLSTSIERDKKVNDFLSNKGYKILRFWGHEINEYVEKCINVIRGCLKF